MVLIVKKFRDERKYQKKTQVKSHVFKKGSNDKNQEKAIKFYVSENSRF